MNSHPRVPLVLASRSVTRARLLAAAGRLADVIADRVSPETRAFLTGPLRQIPDLAVRTADPAGYVAALDGVCRAVGECLVSRFGLDRQVR